MLITEKYKEPPCELTEYTWNCDCNLRKCDKCRHNPENKNSKMETS